MDIIGLNQIGAQKKRLFAWNNCEKIMPNVEASYWLSDTGY